MGFVKLLCSRLESQLWTYRSQSRWRETSSEKSGDMQMAAVSMGT